MKKIFCGWLIRSLVLCSCFVFSEGSFATAELRTPFDEGQDGYVQLVNALQSPSFERFKTVLTPQIFTNENTEKIIEIINKYEQKHEREWWTLEDTITSLSPCFISMSQAQDNRENIQTVSKVVDSIEKRIEQKKQEISVAELQNISKNNRVQLLPNAFAKAVLGAEAISWLIKVLASFSDEEINALKFEGGKSFEDMLSMAADQDFLLYLISRPGVNLDWDKMERISEFFPGLKVLYVMKTAVPEESGNIVRFYRLKKNKTLESELDSNPELKSAYEKMVKEIPQFVILYKTIKVFDPFASLLRMVWAGSINLLMGRTLRGEDVIRCASVPGFVRVETNWGRNFSHSNNSDDPSFLDKALSKTLDVFCFLESRVPIWLIFVDSLRVLMGWPPFSWGGEVLSCVFQKLLFCYGVTGCFSKKALDLLEDIATYSYGIHGVMKVPNRWFAQHFNRWSPVFSVATQAAFVSWCLYKTRCTPMSLFERIGMNLLKIGLFTAGIFS